MSVETTKKSSAQASLINATAEDSVPKSASNKRKSAGNDSDVTSAKANRPAESNSERIQPITDSSEWIALRAQLTAVRTRLVETENKLEVERIQHERDRSAFNSELSKWKSAASSLQGDQSDTLSDVRRHLEEQAAIARNLERELAERIDREQKHIFALSDAERRAAEFELERDAALRRCSTLENELRRSIDELETDRNAHLGAVRSRADTLVSLRSDLEAARKENDVLRSRMEQLREQFEAASNELRTLKTGASQLQRSNMGNTNEQRSGEAGAARHARELDLRVSELEQENSTLRCRSEALDRVEAELRSTQHDASIQRAALSKWTVQLSLLNDVRLDSPENLFGYLADLRAENRLLVAERGAAVAEAATLRAQLAESTGDKEKLTQRMSTCDDELRKQTELVQRYERKARLLRKECDSYLNVIESYHNDSLNTSRSQSNLTSTHATMPPASNENLTINTLNNVQSLYRVVNEQLESQVRRLETELVTSRNANNKLTNELDTLKTECDSLRRRVNTTSASTSANSCETTPTAGAELVAHLRSRIAELERRLGEAQEARERCEAELEASTAAGWYDAQKTKVLTFETNRLPFFSKATGVIEHIAIRSALTRQDTDRQNVSPTSTATAIGGASEHDAAKCDAEKQKLREALKKRKTEQEEMSAAMLREFRSALSEFNDVLYHLFGFRIERMKPSGKTSDSRQIRLQSVFAEDDHDCLLFEQTAQKQILLIENEYVRKIADFVRENLVNLAEPVEQDMEDDRSFYQQTTERQPDNLPVFLARLQLELRRRLTGN